MIDQISLNECLPLSLQGNDLQRERAIDTSIYLWDLVGKMQSLKPRVVAREKIGTLLVEFRHLLDEYSDKYFH